MARRVDPQGTRSKQHVRLSFDDLERFLMYEFDIELETEQRFMHTTVHHHLLTDSTVGRLIDRDRSRVNLYRRDGVPLYLADKIAHHLGVHPLHIWGLAWFTDLELEDHEHEALGLVAPRERAGAGGSCRS